MCLIYIIALWLVIHRQNAVILNLEPPSKVLMVIMLETVIVASVNKPNVLPNGIAVEGLELMEMTNAHVQLVALSMSVITKMSH